VVFGGEFTPPNQLLLEAETVMEEFRRLQSKPIQTGNSSSHTEEERWIPPPRNIVKVNWDAAVDTSKNLIGLGIIARDDKGCFLAAVSKQERIKAEPVVAETLAAFNAILLCEEHNFQDVILEGDALQVVKEVNSDKHCSSYFGHLVEDVKNGLRSLNSAKFSHVRRSANVVAHELALLASTHVTDVIRWNVLPPNISGIVHREREGIVSSS
jgi:ribonuclease HI